MAKITITYCGMDGTGDTVAKAKQDAARKLEAVMAGDWNPFLLTHHGRLAVISRIPKGDFRQWGYALAETDDGSLDLGHVPSWERRDQAIAAAAKHLAQNAGTYVGLERWLTHHEQRDLDSYFTWQKAYAEAKASGCSDEECRRQADIARTGSYIG